MEHPIRSGAASTGGLLTGITIEAVIERVTFNLAAGESLVDFTFSVGGVPLAVAWAATGFTYWYDASDTTSVDDGVTVLVTGDGKRYHIEDGVSLSLNSVLSTATAPVGDEVVGSAYRVATAATGDFAGQDDKIALRTRRGWVFATPEIGLTVYNVAAGQNEQFTAGGWGAFAGSGGGGGAPGLFPFGVAVESETGTPAVSPVDGQYWIVGAAASGAWSGEDGNVVAREGGAWVFYEAYAGAQVYNKQRAQEVIYDEASGLWVPSSPIAPICNGRLTLESGVPISTADQTAKATLFFTPFRGNKVAVYTNGGWALRTFTQRSLTLAGYTSGKPFDIFLYDNAGTLTLESLVWTDDTTRATALALQDGIYVKSGDVTRRYLGTIYTTATGQTEDSLANRYVWNYYNRFRRPMRVNETTSSWSYSSNTLRQARATATNQIGFVCGVNEDEISAEVHARGRKTGSSDGNGGVAIGLDSTTTSEADSYRGRSYSTSGDSTLQPFAIHASYRGFPSVGRHVLVWLEVAHSGTIEFSSSSGDRSGIFGTVLG